MFDAKYSDSALKASDSTILEANATFLEATVPIQSHVGENHGIVDRCVGVNEITGYRNGDETSAAMKAAEPEWRGLMGGRMEMKEEEGSGREEDDMMTLEDFLEKAGAVDGGEDDEVKMPQPEGLSVVDGFGFDPMVIGDSGGSGGARGSSFSMLDRVEGAIVGFGNAVESVGRGGAGTARGKRARANVSGLIEPLDKAALQRQRRMIKNRESAARSRERKQAHQVELELQASKLEEENEILRKEKEERTKELYKQLMEKVIPVDEKRRPRCPLRRYNSMHW